MLQARLVCILIVLTPFVTSFSLVLNKINTVEKKHNMMRRRQYVVKCCGDNWTCYPGRLMVSKPAAETTKLIMRENTSKAVQSSVTSTIMNYNLRIKSTVTRTSKIRKKSTQNSVVVAATTEPMEERSTAAEELIIEVSTPTTSNPNVLTASTVFRTSATPELSNTTSIATPAQSTKNFIASRDLSFTSSSKGDISASKSTSIPTSSSTSTSTTTCYTKTTPPNLTSSTSTFITSITTTISPPIISTSTSTSITISATTTTPPATSTSTLPSTTISTTTPPATSTSTLPSTTIITIKTTPHITSASTLTSASAPTLSILLTITETGTQNITTTRTSSTITGATPCPTACLTSTCLAANDSLVSAINAMSPPTTKPRNFPKRKTTRRTGINTSPSSWPLQTINGRIYHVETSQTLTWYGAQAKCMKNGMTLATIGSQAEHDAIANHLQGAGQGLSVLFIGGNKLGSQCNYVWENGEPMTYSNWAAGNPAQPKTEECMVWMNNEWGDDLCDVAKWFICEQI